MDYSQSDLVAGLNEPQRQAVLAVDGPVLILAGAGSGKTRVVTHRIAHLIRDRGIPPERILAVTFTNKAASEMKVRVQSLLSGHGMGAWVTTFHSMGARILRKHSEHIGYDTEFSMYGPSEQLSLMKRLISARNLDAKQYPPKSALEKISQWKQELKRPEDVDERTINPVFVELYRAYTQELLLCKAMDLDDLLFQLVWLFRKRPEVLLKYQEQFQYIMVDEYQDTNSTQYTLVNMLSAHHGNLCVVGDEDQSIYSWRGADITNILDFTSDFKDSGVKRFELNINYRCPQVCLDAANCLIANNTQRTDKAKLVAHKGGMDRIPWHLASDGLAEARYVMDEIRDQIRQGRRLQDIVILYRTHAQSRVLEQEFLRSDIAYQIVGGHRFYERKEVKDILAYMGLILNPSDAEALYRIINVPTRGIGAVAQEKLAIFAENQLISPLIALSGIDTVTGAARTRMQAFYETMEELIEAYHNNIKLLELARLILEKTGYITYLVNKDEADRVENVEELLSAIADYEEKEPNPTLGGFLERAALNSSLDELGNSSSGSVTMMTLHNAKGLEFPVVFIVGLEEGLFPHRGSLDDPIRQEEERRLCYVGITRTEEMLYLSAARFRLLQGEELFQIPSRFLREIGEDYLCRV
ncbi:MAG: UvrD-helicase domain-containing protein [Candidatus Cloacimonetes bacterium]|nr:UvrD-helicase domain-containing protein [Candidatus Cloacimonadota bacterium]